MVDRPRVTDVVLGIAPPAYTHLEAFELRAGQTVAEALKGSRIRFRVRTNKPVRSAVLVRQSSGKEQEVGPASPGADGMYLAEDQPDSTASYYFRMLDATGLSNISDRSPPVRFSIRLLADKPPRVKMRIRGIGEMITPQAVLPIETDFADSYGLSEATLVHSLGRRDSKPIREPIAGLEPGSRSFVHNLEWPVSSHGASEGDRLTLHAAATDFDDISGPNVGESPPIVLRVVGREELLAELNRREQEYRLEFERLIRQQEELYANLLSLQDKNQQAGAPAERARRFSQLARLQRDYGGRLNSQRLQFEQILSELRVNQLSSPTVEARLGGGVVEPLTVLSRTRITAAADAIDRLAREDTDESNMAARDLQASVLAEMQKILANMLKWEGFQEAVTLLREVLKMQGNLSEETQQRMEAEIFGTAPATQAP